MKKAEILKEITIMIVLVIFSIAFVVYVIPNQIEETSSFSTAGGIGSRTFPYLVVILIGLLAAGQVIKNLVKMTRLTDEEKIKPQVTAEEAQEQRIKVYKTLGLYLLFILFGVLLMNLGFAVAAIIVLPSILYLLGVREWKYYVGILVFATIVFSLFRYVLNVYVPLLWG